MKIGYARVSTEDQDLKLQIDALNQDGCEKIYKDVASGKKDDRSGLAELLAHLREGDIVVVWKLDRLGRSLKHLVETVAIIEEKKVEFRCITEGFDTTTAAGKLFFHVFAAMAEFERALIVERTKAGLAAARARGRKGGNRPLNVSKQDLQKMADMYDDPANTLTVNQILSAVLTERVEKKELPRVPRRNWFYRHVLPLTKTGKKK